MPAPNPTSINTLIAAHRERDEKCRVDTIRSLLGGGYDSDEEVETPPQPLVKTSDLASYTLSEPVEFNILGGIETMGIGYRYLIGACFDVGGGVQVYNGLGQMVDRAIDRTVRKLKEHILVHHNIPRREVFELILSDTTTIFTKKSLIDWAKKCTRDLAQHKIDYRRSLERTKLGVDSLLKYMDKNNLRDYLFAPTDEKSSK